MYRVGLPFWKTAARMGVPLKFRVFAFFDDDAGVFVATSPDVRGLVVEAASLEELDIEIRSSAYDLLSMQVSESTLRKTTSEITLTENLVPA